MTKGTVRQTPCTVLYHGWNITIPWLPNGMSHSSDVEQSMDLKSSSSCPKMSANDVVVVSPLVYGRDTVSNLSGENESERKLPLMKLRLDDWSTGWLIARGYSMVLTDRSQFVESRLVDRCSQEERMDGTLLGGTGRAGGGGGGSMLKLYRLAALRCLVWHEAAYWLAD